MLQRHMMGLSIVLVIGFSLLAVGQPAQAGGMWSSWLYNTQTHQLARVYVDGTVDTTTLSLPEGAIIHGQPAVSSAGNWVAYCMQQPTLKNSASLMVDDIYQDAMAGAYGVTFPVQVDLGPVVGCDVSPVAFNTSRDDQIAVSIVHRFPGDSGADPFTDPLWELLIIDLASQSIAYRLNASSPAIAPLSSIDPNQSFLARVQAFAGDTVTFTLEPFASGGWFVAPTYTWQVGGDQLMPGDYAGMPGHDQITLTDNTGLILGHETLWLGSNPDLPPAKHPQDPVDPFNLVMYAGDNGDAYPILHQPAHLHAACFVNGGQHIAVHVVADDGARWVAVDRAGQVIELPISNDASQLVHAPAGYAYLELGPTTGGSVLHHHRLGDDGTVEDTVLWTHADPGWMMIWAQPLSGTTGLLPFAPLAS